MNIYSPYAYFVYLRRRLKRRQVSLQKPVISVGNLAFGGTGKTPLVLSIVQELLDQGYRVSILSRGYKRTSKGTVVVSDGDAAVASPEDAGEEPFMLARLLRKAVVIVDKSRYRAGRFAEEEFGIDVHVLDDGFQHIQLYRDLDIVCLPARFPTSHGKLREPLAALSYADIAVFTGRSRGTSVDQWRSYLNAVYPSLASVHLPSIVKGFYSSENRPLDPDWVQEQKWVAVSGIARPHRFHRSLRDRRVQIAGVFTFPDHHWPSEADRARVDAFIKDKHLKGIVTTDKDLIKWMGLSGEAISMRTGYPPLPNLLLGKIYGVLQR
ncbi:MAG TPA: tetraacyldisaccharide 4'-kinase [Thermoanaerobaculia bacterium]|nr:tetraacyldisaccharide 4'-kinase [Thermoanaerobaculia bacterium]